MPIAAAQRPGLSRWVHVKAAEFAILFVCAVTLFSLSTQALYLGFQGATIAKQLDITRFELILTVLPHAIPELARSSCRSPPGSSPAAAASGTSCSRRPSSPSLLAIPTLVVAATIEVYVWPHILEAVSPVSETTASSARDSAAAPICRRRSQTRSDAR